MNLCKNCAHYKKNADNIESSECTRKPQFSPISGHVLPTFCNLERAAWGTCKPEGVHFKPRELTMTESELDHEWARRMSRGEYDYDIFCRRLVAGS
jgi:hypothetical protein